MDRLEILNLRKMYEGKALLSGINFHVDAGETLCLLGSSGSGKSTILRIIAGIETPDAGSVVWRGVDVSGTPVHQRRFGLMFQDYALFPHLTVGENVSFGLRMQHTSVDEIERRVQQTLTLVNMVAFMNRRVTDLSGGEQQRVALARALAPGPQLLMLDEPLAALDRTLRVELQEELRDLLHRTGIPTIYVTHDQEEAILLGDRIALLHDGRIEQCGSSEEVYRQPVNTWVARFLGMSNLLSGRVVTSAPLVVETVCGKINPLPPVGAALPKPGQSISLLIRPALIQADASQQSVGRIEGEVDECRFLGDHYRVRLKICSSASLDFISTSPLPIGEHIKLNLRSDEVVAILE